MAQKRHLEYDEVDKDDYVDDEDIDEEDIDEVDVDDKNIDNIDNKTIDEKTVDDKDISEDLDNEETSEESDFKLRVDWKTSEWSRCSATCGQDGKQIREISCVVLRSDGSSPESIPHIFCLDSGLSIPATMRPCDIRQCPQWNTKQWNKCSHGKCLARHTALQSREVVCHIPGDNETMDENFCEAILKPKTSRTCYFKKCRPIWKAEEWSECSSSCGGGVKTRNLTCVWKADLTPAGDLCRDLRKRPKENAKCNVQDCPTTTTTTTTSTTSTTSTTTTTTTAASTTTVQIVAEETTEFEDQDDVNEANPLTWSECESDQSEYCGLVKTLKMCHMEKYQKICCSTCTEQNSV